MDVLGVLVGADAHEHGVAHGANVGPLGEAHLDDHEGAHEVDAALDGPFERRIVGGDAGESVGKGVEVALGESGANLARVREFAPAPATAPASVG